IEKNPLLERVDTRGDEIGDPEPVANTDSGAAVGLDTMFEAGDTSAATMAERLDTSMENVFPDDPGQSEAMAPDLAAQWKSAESGGSGSGEGYDIESFAAGKVTLGDHVGEQMAFTFRDPVDLFIARELCDALDEIGYM